MESRATALGHPVHQMLIAFPLGLLASAVIFGNLGLITDNSRARRVGMIHGIGNVGVVTLFAISRTRPTA